MGERKGVNKYYPPDYDPTKGSLNAYHGTHALRERAAKIHEGIIIIRFEMPFNVWCLGCGRHIGMGVRYNAEKRKMGYYYSTPIYKFRMRCHLCEQYFEIQTDPKNCDYNLLSGVKRKEERWDTKASENVQSMERGMREKLMTDMMFKLEHQSNDGVKAKRAAPTLTRLEEIRDDWVDDFALNQRVRQKFREERKDLQKYETDADALKSRASLPLEMSLTHETDEDVERAKRVNFGDDHLRPDLLRKRKKREIKESSIFETQDAKQKLAKSIARNSSKTFVSKTQKDSVFGDIIVKPKPKSSLSDSIVKTSPKHQIDEKCPVNAGSSRTIDMDKSIQIDKNASIVENSKRVETLQQSESKSNFDNKIESKMAQQSKIELNASSILVDYGSSGSSPET